MSKLKYNNLKYSKDKIVFNSNKKKELIEQITTLELSGLFEEISIVLKTHSMSLEEFNSMRIKFLKHGERALLITRTKKFRK